ncbi:MAG TPA: PAS domain S-box protein [Myxococcota bacterium]|nr:PAS domain S-box protein [Myxococcota bacterium]
MGQALSPSRRSRGLRIPLWDDYGQAERFAGVLALTALVAAVPYLLADRVLVAEICVAIATVLFGLCTWSARGGPRWALGIGTPFTMTLGALALLVITAGTCVAAAAVLALAPAVALLWGPPRAGWLFLATTIAGGAVAILLAPDAVPLREEPWIADARAPWLIVPLAGVLFLLARSWLAAHGTWQDEVHATHAVLAASEARFKAYVENAHDVTAELDARGRVLFITSRTEGHYALPVAELLGTSGSEYIHPDDVLPARRAFEKAARGHPNVSPPLRYRGSASGWRFMRVAVNAYRTAHGELRFVLQARDETALQEAQAERDRLVAELERALQRSETLQGRIAMCASCKDVKNERGEWERVDEFLASHTRAELSHGMCPRCIEAKI